MNKLISLLIVVWSMTAFADVPVHEDRNEAEYNNQFAVVLNGMDPVSYFTGTPLQGDSSISFVYGTRMYHFATTDNMEAFKKNPLKFEPTYGSWCAWAMAQGSPVAIKTQFYTIRGNRLHFFFSKSAKNSFDADADAAEKQADINWKGFSGEEPRL